MPVGGWRLYIGNHEAAAIKPMPNKIMIFITNEIFTEDFYYCVGVAYDSKKNIESFQFSNVGKEEYNESPYMVYPK